MRFAPILILLVGCGPYTPTKGDSGSTSIDGCADAGFEPAISPSLTVTGLVYNSGALSAGFDPSASYDPWGASGCYNATTGEFQWIFESGGEVVGALRAEGDTLGNQNMSGGSGTFRFDFYDGATIENSFDNTEFVTGAYTVDSLSPFQVSILGDAVDAGNTLSVTATARATAP